MSKKEELIKTYMSDIQLSSSKQKFGYFSIPPSPFAGSQEFEQKTGNFLIYSAIKNQNGKVKTQQRNIFSGVSASGVLKKSYFSYPEYKTGQKYMDPGKVERLKQMKENQKYKDKQTFRPASLNKTICTASYEYVPQKQTRKDPKFYRTQDGKIRTQNPNITSNPASKINYKSQTQLKYMNDPYDNARVMRRKQLFDDISKRGQTAFRSGSPVKEFFSSIKDQFHQVDLPQKKKKQTDFKIQQHDSSFRPAGNHFNDGMFSYPKHVPQQADQKDSRKIEKSVPKNQGQKKEPFKLIKQEKNSKPCPSISLSKMNLMRCIR